MPKLSWELDLKGGETVAQKFRDLNKELQGLKRGVSAGDLLKASGGNFSASMLKLNPGLAQMLQAAQAPKSDGIGGFVPPRLTKLLGAMGGGESSLLKGIGGILGGLAAFKIGLWALSPVIDAVKFSLHHLAEAIQEGSKLYTDAAKLGKNASTTFGLQYIARDLNMSPEEIERMTLRGQFPNAGRSGGSAFRRSTFSMRGMFGELDGTRVGAIGVNQIGELQKISNLQKDIADSSQRAAMYESAFGSNARTLYVLQTQLNEIVTEWKLLWQDIAVVLSRVIYIALEFIKIKLQNFIALLEGIKWIAEKLGVADFSEKQNRQFTPATNRLFATNQFQRMGFNMSGGFQAQDETKKIAINTQKMVGLLEKIASGKDYQGSPMDVTRFAGMMP